MSELKLNDEDGNEETYDRNHAYLYTFFGHLAVHDHVFLLLDEEDGLPTATYFWKIDPNTLETNPEYEPVAQYLMDNDFPLCLNSPNVPKQDREIWRWQFGVDEVYDNPSFPESWNEQ